MTLMATIKADDIAGQQSSHQVRKGDISGSEQEMGVIGKK
jgi:hypothetical protein